MPWQVSLENASGDHFCGGSIVHESWIVTAAHCVDNVGTITVHAGATDQTNNAVGQRIAVDQIIIHDDFDVGPEETANDIALLHLQTPLTFNADVQPICVTDGILPIPIGTVAIISGWGDTGAGCCSDVLMMAQVPVISDANANNLINNNNNACDPNNAAAVGPSTIAFFQQGIAAGMGDSGGPAVVVVGGIPVLVGTSSWGGCPRDDFPTMYGDVSELSQSVFENALDLDQCPCLPPVVALNSVTISCPVDEDLNTLVTSTLPTGSILVWSTDDDPDDGVSPHIVGNVNRTGTYFGYYYNAESGCYSPPSEGVVVDGAQNQDVHITTNTTYSTDMDQFGNIYVENGATLTITSTVTLDHDVTIFVEDDSKLILDGGTLTACSDKWQGIKVAGQFDLGTLSPAGSSSLKRGYVLLKNSAVIEKAIVGIDGRDVFMGGGDTPPTQPFHHGGGKITVTNSTIQECGTGIRLHRYGWGSVTNTGPGGPGYPIGYEDEQSSVSQSWFKGCNVAIFTEYNIGLSLTGNTFVENFTDYEGYLSAVTVSGNAFTSFAFIGSEYPLIVGSSFVNNTFTNSAFGIDAQGNMTRHNFRLNTASSNSLLALSGELWYLVDDNEFTNCPTACFIESTGDNIRNTIMNNAFNSNGYANSVYGENDMEFIANCFSGTSDSDIEINHSASIHEVQGTQDQSAGNCFHPGARIMTGSNIGFFTYWTKDGYDPECDPVNDCKYPGDCDGFSLERSDLELDVDCETNIVIDPPSEITCVCDPGASGCTTAIASIRETLDELEEEAGEGKELQIAQYRRCLDELMRTYVDTSLAVGNVESTITYLRNQPEFRYRIMAYGIMVHNLEYDRARGYIDTLSTSKTEEQDFIAAQQIYLDYITDIDSFVLSPTDSMTLRLAGEAFNSLSGYARTIFYKITGERITRNFIHIDSTVTPRSNNESFVEDVSRISTEFDIWPNPMTSQNLNIRLNNTAPDKEYLLVVYDAFGKMHYSAPVTSGNSSLPICDVPGIYMVCLLQDGEMIRTKKVIKI